MDALASVDSRSWGKRKTFLVGHKDWIVDGRVLGRTVLYLSLDYAMLPFLYSANPYFELLRVNSLPSLNEFDFRLAVFDLDGRLLFNPNKISTGLSPDLLRSLGPDGRRLWTEFADKGAVYRLYAFRAGNRIYALFSPRKTFLQAAVDFSSSSSSMARSSCPVRLTPLSPLRPEKGPPSALVVRQPSLYLLRRRGPRPALPLHLLLPELFHPHLHPAVRRKGRNPRQYGPQRDGRFRLFPAAGEEPRSRPLPKT